MSSSIENLLQRVGHFLSTFPFLRHFKSDLPEGEIALVGGSVRDFFLSRNTKDADFLVRKVSAPHLHQFLSRHGKVSFVGKTFGVYKFRPFDSDIDIDIALPRTERSFSKKGAYRDFEIQTDPNLPIEDDLKRRDFTINAMAVDLTRLCLIDPFEGLKDLESGTIRAVGEPSVRFSEDYSRLLRGIRFACQFRFHIEPVTWKALCHYMAFINAKNEDETFVVPRETIAKEMLRALVYDPVRLLDLWDQSGAFSALIPEILKMKGCPQPEQFHSEGDVWTHSRLALAELSSSRFQEEFQSGYDAEVALSVLLHDIGKPYTLQTPERDGVDRIRFNNHDTVGARLARGLVERLKLSSLPKDTPYAIDEDQLAWLIEKHLILVHGDVDEMRASTLEKYFLSSQRPGQKLMQLIFCDGNATIPKDASNAIRHYQKLKIRIETLMALGKNKTTLPPPYLSGREVMAILQIPSGPDVGRYLGILREEQLLGRLANREEAMTFLKRQAASPS